VKTSYKKRIILLVIILTTIAIIRFSGVDRYLTFENLQENKFRLQQIVEGNYLRSIGGYVLLYIVVVAFSIPGATILTLSGGFLFGVIWGAVYVNVGATTGAALAFLFCRYVAGEWVQNKYGDKLNKFNKELEENGYRYLLALRLIPVFPFFMINIFAGLTKFSLRTFIWTTSVGILPGSLVYAFAGNQLNAIESVKDIFSAKIIGAFSLLALFVLFPVIVNYIKRKRLK
jgi:uncharacterized membrane protein YdjX (TVP38/TMEM64 family)